MHKTKLDKTSRFIVDSLLVVMLLGILVLPISSVGLLNLGVTETQVLSSHDVKPNTKTKTATINEKVLGTESTESSKSSEKTILKR